ncbi:hypothetical protein [Salana multivorans]
MARSSRGVFLDYGELEHVNALESRVTHRQAAASYGPGPEQPGRPAAATVAAVWPVCSLSS